VDKLPEENMMEETGRADFEKGMNKEDL